MAKSKRRRVRKKGRYDRLINVRPVRQRFLIVCEGEKTEPNYFRSFRVPKLVVDVKGLGVSPRQLVEKALSLKEQDEYDQIWCVFDRDDLNVGAFNGAIQRAESQGLRVAYSNQAFELWYLLHFHFYNTPMRRIDYTEKLSELLPHPYLKNDLRMYDQLFSRQTTAIRNANRLLKQFSPLNPGTNDPSATVHMLVQELNRFLPETRAMGE